jgi:hypothetical protein
VAETPPTSLDRYFYFEDVTSHDSLFRYVAKLVLGASGSRSAKADALVQLRDRGIFLIDAKPDPFDNRPLSRVANELVARCRELEPDRIILIKASVYDAVFAVLRDADLPVVDRRVPFPGSGQQRRFETEFALALGDARQPKSGDDRAHHATAEPFVNGAADRAPKLHEEIARLLADGRWRTTSELAALVNDAGRYHKGDGTLITPFQIHGRTRKYDHLFERDGSRVRLRPRGR